MLPDPDLVPRFSALFAGRRDVWGAVHGECKRSPLTYELLHEHLFGSGSVGVYPLLSFTPRVVAELDVPVVHWGCSDIDRGLEMMVLARNLQRALSALGLSSWIERSKGKGYHVWVFADSWVPAEGMRRALLVAHQLAGVPPTEVNPKQTSVENLAEGLGNYVNLPYAKSYADMSKRVVLDDHGVPMRLDQFLDAAEASLNDATTIAAAATLYVPPPPRSAVEIAAYDGEIDDVVRKLGGLAFTIFNDGPTERFGYKRYRTLQRLAFLCKDSHLTPSEAFAVLRDADLRWGKFHERPDCDRWIEETVAKAYG